MSNYGTQIQITITITITHPPPTMSGNIHLHGILKKDTANDTHWSTWTGMWAFGDVSTWLPMLQNPNPNQNPNSLDLCVTLEDVDQHKFSPKVRQKGPLPFEYKCSSGSRSSSSAVVVDKKQKQQQGDAASSAVKEEDDENKRNDKNQDKDNVQNEKFDNDYVKENGKDASGFVKRKVEVEKRHEISLKEKEQNNYNSESDVKLKWKWAGEFLNISRRMDRSPLKTVEESFEMEIDGLEVNAVGRNRFGNFQLVGSMQIEESGLSAILTCQKLYMIDSLGSTSSGKKRGRGRPPRNSSSLSKEPSTPGSNTKKSSGGAGGSGYFTRKRIMSWQRPLFHEKSDYENHTPKRTSSYSAGTTANHNTNKASKSSATPNANANQTSNSSSHSSRKRGRPPNLANRSKAHTGESSASALSVANQGQVARASSIGMGHSMILSGGTQALRTKSSTKLHKQQSLMISHQRQQQQTSVTRTNTTPASTRTSRNEPTCMLPSTYDPLEARWLSAHYMDVNGMMCIYEGDLDFGGNKRHGQGITMVSEVHRAHLMYLLFVGRMFD